MGAYRPFRAIPEEERAVILAKNAKICGFLPQLGHIDIGIAIFRFMVGRVYDFAGVLGTYSGLRPGGSDFRDRIAATDNPPYRTVGD